MYEKGSAIKVTINIGDGGIKELDFVGKIVIDGNDFMAVQFDTIIIPKVDIKAAEPIPDGKDLEHMMGVDKGSGGGGIERPEPPKVGNVRFLSLESDSLAKTQAKPPQASGQQPHGRPHPDKQHPKK
jgi:hypothetical protein